MGALARAGLATAVPPSAGRWPWITFLINVSGAFVLGALTTRLHLQPAESPYWRPLIGTGFCGAYTTFSTMQLELLKMLDHDRDGLALLYVAASVTCGYAAVALAHVLMQAAWRRAAR